MLLWFITQIKESKCQSCVKINITETEEEIKALLGKAKDAYSYEKLLALRVAQNQNRRNCIVNSRRARKTSHHGAPDGGLVIVKGEGQNYYLRNPVGEGQE